MSTSEGDRKNILRQMKVRTTYKKDKSWIHQQNSEDERDEIPISPQRKSFDGSKVLWSPNLDSRSEKNAGTFTAREVITASSPPIHSSNKQFSYNEINKSTSTTTQASPPQSGVKVTPSYIIRGQPFNATPQLKNPPSYNGYQKSYSAGLPRQSASLPRVPNATGHKMSTEEYKKLAPYNVRSSRSVDLSDDESYAQEQSISSEQTNRIMKNTPPRDRSYVLSAAKRTAGNGSPEATVTSPFTATKVQIQEETSPNKKSQTLPKTLSTYLYDDYRKAENNWKETSSNQATSQITSQPTSQTTSQTTFQTTSKTSPQTSPQATPRTSSQTSSQTTSQTSSQTFSQTAPSGSETERSCSPKLTSYSIAETKASEITPEPGRITVVRDQSINNDKNVSKPAAERQLPPSPLAVRKESNNNEKTVPKPAAEILPTSPMATRKERVEITKKSDTLPESLASYLYDDVSRLEKSYKANQGTMSTSQTVTTSNNEKTVSKPAAGILPTSPMATRKERVEITKKSDTLPESLASYLYDDVNRFEKGWKSNQPTESTSQTVTTTRETGRPESPKLTSWTGNTESKTPSVKPEPGKITVFRGESGANDLSIPRLTSSNTESKGPILHSEPGRITVLTDERSDSYKETPKPSAESRPTAKITDSKDAADTIKLTSSSLPTSGTDSTQAWAQTGPGKVTVIGGTSDIDNSKVTSKSSEITTTTTRARVTIETITDSTSPKPTRRMETKPKEAAPAKASYNQQDLISWSDLDSNTKSSKTKEKSTTPAPTPIQTSKDSVTSVGEPLLTISTPELKSSRTNQPTKPGYISAVDETRDDKARYRVTENLDDPEFDLINNQSTSRSKQVTIVETQAERPRTPEQRSSSPRPTPRPRESLKTTVTESRYRVPETLDDTMLAASPSRSGSRTTVTTTRSTDPVYTEYMEGPNSRSARTVSSSRETVTTTTTDTRHANSSSAEASQYDPYSSNKGVLFLKEYVNSRESLTSPTSSGSIPDFSDDMERISYSTSSSYLYSSPPERADEGPCSYCGRPIKDCPKIILEHLNIHCHEYCFKCGICNKPMGDLVDSIFIHRDVVHCESCYEKLF